MTEEELDHLIVYIVFILAYTILGLIILGTLQDILIALEWSPLARAAASLAGLGAHLATIIYLIWR